tara:strand:- start:309 stop:731 length:423 start_codon:yes stop_codon:yes gene_type:complete
MLSFFKPNKINIIGFEDIKTIINNPSTYLLINTLSSQDQDILIKNTIVSNDEEEVINNMLNDYNLPNKPIAIYGKNTSDKSVEKKYDQLLKYGIKELYIYYGGLFEWLLLNEIYGCEEFPLNKNHSTIDILKYRNSKVIL